MIVYYLVAKAQNLTFAPRSRAAVARRAHNPKVTGSIPVFATKKANPHFYRFGDFFYSFLIQMNNDYLLHSFSLFVVISIL